MTNGTVEIVLPECSQDEVSNALRMLTEYLVTKGVEKSGGALGGEFGYGVHWDDEVFMMHPFCWCEREDCKWCSYEEPNFYHKKTGIRIWWYKYIGRSMEIKTDKSNHNIGITKIILSLLEK